MKKIILTVTTILALASCNSSVIPIERMSEQELFAYNSSVDFWDQVYCTNDIRTGSHIRKRVCATLNELQDYNSNQVGILFAASSGLGAFR